MSNSKKDFNYYFKHFFIIGSGSFISILIGLITTPIITRIVDTNSYGQLAIFNVFVNIGLFVFLLGLDQSLIRFYYEKKNSEHKKTIIRFCWLLPSIIVVLLLLFTIFAYVINIIPKSLMPYVTMVLVGIFSQILYRISLLVIRLEKKSKMYALISITYKLIYLILVLIFAKIYKNNYFYALVFSTLLSAFISAFIGIICKIDLWNPFFKGNEKLNHKELLKYGAPFIISSGIHIFYNAVDKLSIKLFFSYSDVGIYASAVTIIGIFNIIQTTFNSLWYPMAMEHYTNDKNDTLFYSKCCRIITVIMFVFGTTVIVFKDLIVLMLGSQYRSCVFIIPFLAFEPILYTISESTVRGIDFAKKSKYHVYISGITLVTNFVLNIILLKIFGIIGAAIATAISYILFFVLRTTISTKLFKVDYDFKKIMTLISFTFVFAILNAIKVPIIINICAYIIIQLTIFILYKETILFLFDNLKKLVFKRKGEV